MTPCRIKDVARVNRHTLPEDTDPDWEFYYIDIGSVNQHAGVSIPSVMTKFRNAPSRARRLAMPGDVVVATVRPHLRAIALVPKCDVSMVFSTGFATLEACGIDSHYLAFWCQSQPFIDAISSQATGVGYPAVGAEKVREAPIDIPTRQTQAAISRFLVGSLGKLDELIHLKEATLKRSQERRESAVGELCLGQGPLDVRGARRTSTMGIPHHWAVVRNKVLLIEVDDRSTDGTEELLTVSHLTGVTPRSEKTVYMFEAESKAGYKRCKPGDLVVNTMWAWMGALGISQVAGIVSPAYAVYRFRCSVEVEYYHYLYRTLEYISEMARFSKGVWTSRLRLYPEVFLSLTTPLPPRDEQQAIVRAIHTACEPYIALETSIERSMAILTERRQALITAAVTGQIDVSAASGRGVMDGLS